MRRENQRDSEIMTRCLELVHHLPEPEPPTGFEDRLNHRLVEERHRNPLSAMVPKVRPWSAILMTAATTAAIVLLVQGPSQREERGSSRLNPPVMTSRIETEPAQDLDEQFVLSRVHLGSNLGSTNRVLDRIPQDQPTRITL